MFNANMNSFVHDSVTVQFIDNNTNRSGIDIEYSSGSSVIKFKRHTLELGKLPYVKIHQQQRRRNHQLCKW
jgi:hypothetical protein